jgi:hypothetical protein
MVAGTWATDLPRNWIGARTSSPLKGMQLERATQKEGPLHRSTDRLCGDLANPRQRVGVEGGASIGARNMTPDLQA